MTKRIILLSILFFITLAFTQGPGIDWTRIYGGEFGEEGNSVIQTADDGYVIVGYSDIEMFQADVYLIKTDSLGYMQWEQFFGGPYIDEGYEVKQTADLGFIIVGRTFSYGAGNEDVYLIKTDSLGNMMFSRTFGGSHCDIGRSVLQTTDGGYIIVGYTESFPANDMQVYLIRTDSSGDTLWTKTYGGQHLDYGFSVQQTADQGFIIAGTTNSFGINIPDTDNFFLIKTDSLGDTLWTRAYGDSLHERAYSVEYTTDGDYVIAGTGLAYDYFIYLVKTDASGDTVWTKIYDHQCYSIQQTRDGGYIAGGYGNNPGYYKDMYLLKTDANGDTLWTKLYGTRDTDYGLTACQTSDNGYVIVGKTFLAPGNFPDIFLVKTKSDTLCIEEGKDILYKIGNYSETIICGPILLPEGKNCRVFDITGRVVEPRHIRPGVYFIEVDGKITQKVVKIR